MIKGKPISAPPMTDKEREFCKRILSDNSNRVLVLTGQKSPIDMMVESIILFSDFKPDTKIELISNMKEKEIKK